MTSQIVMIFGSLPRLAPPRRDLHINEIGVVGYIEGNGSNPPAPPWPQVPEQILPGWRPGRCDEQLLTGCPSEPRRARRTCAIFRSVVSGQPERMEAIVYTVPLSPLTAHKRIGATAATG